ncbi:retrovirus-related pol polyprotein from transposon TNT 1-94 [Tanacetum coccineum]
MIRQQADQHFGSSFLAALSIRGRTWATLASKSPEWVQAMQDELNALEKNHTWELTSLPAGHKAISSKWVYKIKYKATVAIDKYKARLVIRATAKGWQLHQLDINNAFLHGFIDEDIYMQPPAGYNGASPG